MKSKCFIFLLIISLVVISGCSSTKVKKEFIPRVETVTVYKPVFTPPEELKNIQEVPRPDLETNHLIEEDKKHPDKVIKALIAAIIQLRVYAEQLENNEKVYRKSLIPPDNLDSE